MLEDLPPNIAAHRLILVTDERRARAVADLIVESFEPAEAASTAFETDDALPRVGKTWLVEAYFGFEPDEDEIRALIAAVAGEETAQSATFGVVEKRDWVATSLAGLTPVQAGRFLVHGSHDRARDSGDAGGDHPPTGKMHVTLCAQCGRRRAARASRRRDEPSRLRWLAPLFALPRLQ